MKVHLSIIACFLFGATCVAGCGGGGTPASPTATGTESAALSADEGRLVGFYDGASWIAPPAGASDEAIVEALASATRGINDDPVDFAKAHIGDPYVYGAIGPKKWDCSGLTQGAYKVVKVSLPRTAAQQSGVGTKITRANLKRCDLVFFDTVNDPSKGLKSITHVGIMLDNNTMIDANSYASKITTDNLNDTYWKTRFMWGRRVR